MKKYYGGDRIQGYPVHETKSFKNINNLSPYALFEKTWKEKQK